MKTSTLKTITSLLVITAMIAFGNLEVYANYTSNYIDITNSSTNRVSMLETPTALEATNITHNSFQPNWNKVDEVDYYKLYVYIKVGKLQLKLYQNDYNPKVISNQNLVKSEVQNLKMNTTYYYVVSAVIQDVESPISNEISLTTLITTPEPPTATEATNITTNSFQANWEKSDGATGYKVTIVNNDEQDYVQHDGIIDNGSTTNLEVNGLNANTSYSYTVQATNSEGTSETSNFIRVNTYGIPDAPVAKAATNITTNSFQANWEVVPGATGYLISAGDEDSHTHIELDTKIEDGNTNSFQLTRLNADTPYTYVIKAYNDQGISGYSNFIFVNTFGIPDAPVTKAATNITTNSFQANWEVVPGATEYIVTVLNDDEQENVQLDGNISDSNITSLIVSELTPETNYSYYVKARNDQGISEYSNRTSLQTIAYRELILNTNTSEGGTVSGEGIFEKGSNVTANANANSGYVFLNWTENGEEVSTQEEFTFTLEANRTLIANFELTTSINNIKNTGVTTWPNPFSTTIHISELPNSSSIEIVSVDGTSVLKKLNCKGNETLNLRSLKSGIYILIIKSTQGYFTQKIIKN